MKLRDLFAEAFQAFSANKARNILTLLGIVIGISAVIAMTSLIGGIKTGLVSQLGLEQSRAVFISCSYNRSMTSEDMDTLEKYIPDYEFVTGASYTMANISTEEKTEESCPILAAYPEYFRAAIGIKLIEGRYFSAQENAANAQLVILNEFIAEKLFGSSTAALGKNVSIGNDLYTIIGISEASGTIGQGPGTSFIPYNTALARIFGSEDATSLQLIGFAAEGADISTIADRTKSFLVAHFQIPPEEADNYISIQTMKSVLDELNAMMMSFQLLMTSVASISLLVGGIGIMNMMLTNVTERIKEIGLRKALGARSSDITKQFLLESVLICLVGGIIGIAFGYIGAIGLSGIANQAAQGMTIRPSLDISSILITCGICFAIGVIFGYYPARRAAKLNPVESLRFQ